MGMALRGYYTSDRHDEPWIDSHLDIRDPTGAVVPGYGWIFPLGDGRVNVGVGLLSTGGAWKGVNTTKLQEYFVSQTADAWGLNDESCCGPATGGRLPMGLAPGRIAAAVLAEALLHNDSSLLGLYDERLESAYGDYFKVARAFVRIISEPKVLSACVGVGLRIEPLMNELLAIMANLMRNDKNGPAEIGYRALLRLSDVIPERAYAMLLNSGKSKD
jgi:flavin-dependent dehydrogenase